MRETEHDRLGDLAAAVADKRALDWDEIESSARDDGERLYIRRLRAIAAIGHAHAELTFAGETSQSIFPRGAVPDVDGVSTPSQWGSLRVLERVGRGRFGDVYRAWDPSLAREVALKLLRRRDVESVSSERAVIEEGRLMARVRHQNVVAIYGAQRIDGRTGLWMEFVDGRTLDAELKERGALPAEDVARIGVELCRALSAVHDAGLVHRDVKAQNVMRDRHGRVLLGDFGTGREHEDAEDAGDVVGTPAYLAPEVLRGAPATRQSDVYSLGVLLFRLATGTYPVAGRSMRDIRAAHERRAAVSLEAARPGLPRLLVSTIERALHPDPSSRFDNAAALQSALEPCTRPQPSGSSPGYRIAGVAVASVLGLAVVVTLAVNVWKPAPSPQTGSDKTPNRPVTSQAPTPIAEHATPSPSVSQLERVDVVDMPPPSPPRTPPVYAPLPLPLATAEGYAALAQDHLRRGDIAEARRYAGMIPTRDHPDATGPETGQWRLMFEAQASWQALDAPASLKAHDEFVRRDKNPSQNFIIPMMYVRLGRLKQAARLVEALQAPSSPVASVAGNPPGSLWPDTMLATVLELSDDRTPLRNLLLTRPRPAMIDTRLRVLMRAGLVDEAEAQVARLKIRFDGTLPISCRVYEAEVAVSRGEPALAIELLNDLPTAPTKGFSLNFWELARVRALAWHALGDTERAIATLNDVVAGDRHSVAHTSNAGPWMEHRALLAKLYRSAGMTDAAAPIENELRKLLAVADADHPIVRQLGIRVSGD